MNHEKLSESSDWEIDDSGQDIRGQRLVNDAGVTLGTINDLVIDTAAQRVETAVLDNGVEYPIANIELGDGYATLHQSPLSGVPYPRLRATAPHSMHGR